MMPKNSHCPAVDETQKLWSRTLTTEEYDLHVLTAEEFCMKYRVSSAKYLAKLLELEVRHGSTA
jgi:hypothetical protein